MPALGEEVKEEDGSSFTHYASVTRDDITYAVGDCCYVMPTAYGFDVKQAVPKKIKVDKSAVSDWWRVLSLM